MISLKQISLEYKTSALLGCIALILSFLTGLIAGISWSVVILRTFILMLVFAAIGYGAATVLKIFVPEVYNLLVTSSAQGPKETPAKQSVTEPAADGEAKSAPAEEEAAEIAAMPDISIAEAPAAESFKELEKENLAHFSTAKETGAVNTGAGKLGKHILEKEKLAKYEPKIMAQAVRTMMSKDGD